MFCAKAEFLSYLKWAATSTYHAVFLCWCYRFIVFKNNPNRLGSNRDIIWVNFTSGDSFRVKNVLVCLHECGPKEDFTSKQVGRHKKAGKHRKGGGGKEQKKLRHIFVAVVFNTLVLIFVCLCKKQKYIWAFVKMTACLFWFCERHRQVQTKIPEPNNICGRKNQTPRTQALL